MDDSIYTPPEEWVRGWSADLINKKVSKGEGCRQIAKSAASWGFGKGLALGQIMGAAKELEECCAQISQCHLLTPEQGEKIAEYLHEIRTETFDR